MIGSDPFVILVLKTVFLVRFLQQNVPALNAMVKEPLIVRDFASTR